MPRRRALSLLAAATAVLGAATACAHSAATPAPEAVEPSRARAALASLFVENQTAQRLTILYRFANRNAPDVGIGVVLPGITAELAPVPAGEPLLLVARTGDGSEASVGPRSFPIDGAWTWRIDGTTRFAPPRGVDP